MTSGKSAALVKSRAAPSTATRATDFPAVTKVCYCPRVRAITNTYCWLSVVIVGYSWLSLVISGYRWLFLVIVGYQWFSLLIVGYQLLLLVISG